jgi:5-methylcytosine-specific restriction endonuclease McrA
MNRSDAGKLGYEKTKHIHDALRDERSRKLREEYELDPKLCLFCGTKITFERRRATFCNCSCSASYSNRVRPRETKRSRVCSCGKPKLLSNKYCSDCIERRVYQRPQSVELLKAPASMRRLLIEQRGHQCEDCGLSEWKSQPIPLELHHKDGNSDNNTEQNLMLICPNCHTFTEHYKGSVKGKDGSRQKMRRKRYANGETW